MNASISKPLSNKRTKFIMKKLLLAIIHVTTAFSANAQLSEQNEMRKNSIYSDSGLITDFHAFVNYERSLYQGK
jgi:hypothetical protein